MTTRITWILDNLNALNSRKFRSGCMRKISLLLFFLCLFSCNSEENKAIDVTQLDDFGSETVAKELSKEPSIDSLKLNINFTPKGQYITITNSITADKSYFKKAFEINPTKAVDSASKYLYSKLINEIVPHWYGTPWDFNGYSNVPNKGEIACGYFVSTTLKDMGLKLNRYKLAQKSPIDEAMVISCGTEITTIKEKDSEQTLAKIESLVQRGVYFIGFDTGHVGFLVKKGGTLYLIHSNYLFPISVCIEPLKDARVFKKFTKFHLVDISHNDFLIKKWLNGDLVL